jgi:hypothetical protein
MSEFYYAPYSFVGRHGPFFISLLLLLLNASSAAYFYDSIAIYY